MVWHYRRSWPIRNTPTEPLLELSRTFLEAIQRNGFHFLIAFCSDFGAVAFKGAVKKTESARGLGIVS